MSSFGPVVVLNPNSTEAVTEGLRAALEPLALAGGPPIECLTLAEGPPGIETDAHTREVVAPLVACLERHQARAGAFVIACFSDPGINEARAAIHRPVFGMAESGYLTALTRGRRFGVLSILSGAIDRHLRYIRALGLESRLAGDRAIDLGVVELADEARTFDRLVEVGTRLRDEDGAEVALLGCAGLASQRLRLEAALGIPVIEPVQAAVTMAIGAVALGAGAPAPAAAAE